MLFGQLTGWQTVVEQSSDICRNREPLQVEYACFAVKIWTIWTFSKVIWFSSAQLHRINFTAVQFDQFETSIDVSRSLGQQRLWDNLCAAHLRCCG